MNDRKKFFQNVLPSIFAFALSGIYAIVDGFFVGNSVGDAGLAAINTAYPAVGLFQALGTGIGMGGAILYSVYWARGQHEKAKKIFTVSCALLVIFSVISTIVVMLVINPLLSALGASGEILALGQQYLKVIVIGSVFQVLATGLVPFLRNFGGTLFAMITMITGFLVNILLDYVFVWVLNYSLGGAALATIIGQAISLILCIVYLVVKKHGFMRITFKEGTSIAISILKTAVSPLGLTFSPNITLIIMNRFTLSYGGTRAVAAYAVMSYLLAILILLSQGVGDGCQPLMSVTYGANQTTSLKRFLRYAYITSVCIATICATVLVILRYRVGLLFGASQGVVNDVAFILIVYAPGFLLAAFIRISISYFYATGKNIAANICVYGEPISLLISLAVIPRFFGIIGVWLCIPIMYFAITLVSILLLLHYRKKQNRLTQN